MSVALEAWGTNAYNCYAMCPAGQGRVIFGTYKLPVLKSLWLLPLYLIFFTWAHMYDFLRKLILQYFYLIFLIIGSHIVFISMLGLLNRSLQPNICADSLRCLILQCSSLPIILTSSHKGRWFLFSFHICPAIPDFSISPRTTAFWCSFSMSCLYILYHNYKGWSKHSS